jgi:hypothetical protein
LFGTTAARSARAQDPAQPPPPPPEQPTITAATPAATPDDDDARLRPMEPDYSLVNLPTTLPLPVHAGNFHLSHRFNDNLIASNTDIGDHAAVLFGLDSGANIGLEYRFGVLRHLEAIIQRTSIGQTIQFSAKYDGWRQGGGMPVSISAIVSVEGERNFGANTNGEPKHYSPAVGAVISRTFAEHVALYAMPMWVHGTPGPSVPSEDTTIIGLGARLRVMPTTYLVGEVTPRVGGYVLRDPEFGFSLEKRVGAHVFALTFTNNPGTTFRQIALGGNPHTLNLGFNLTRKFF